MSNPIPEGFKYKPRKRPLSLKEKTCISEYLKTGNKSASIRAAYDGKAKYAHIYAEKFFKKPKIIDALNKALKDSKFDDDYAVKKMKELVEAGMENKETTRPETALRTLETYFKITNKMGGGNKDTVRMDPETIAKKMDTSQLLEVIKELGKREKRIMSLLKGTGPKVVDGEVIK